MQSAHGNQGLSGAEREMIIDCFFSFFLFHFQIIACLLLGNLELDACVPASQPVSLEVGI
jgi:hypothetical protein